MTYRSGPPPDDVKLLGAYTEEQLREVSENLDTIDNLTLVELNVVPVRPRTGLFALADGTNWNPGGGPGIYVYFNGGWNLLVSQMVEVFSSPFSIDFS